SLRPGRRWGTLEQAPDIDMPKKPDGRREYLDEGEITRLLKACEPSRNRYFATIVTVALTTGMRKAGVLGLGWDRIELGTARISLYKTKSGKPRGVPLIRPVYEALTALEPDEKRRV